jgi:hypothetical protein
VANPLASILSVRWTRVSWEQQIVSGATLDEIDETTVRKVSSENQDIVEGNILDMADTVMEILNKKYLVRPIS